jgi:hypothetical protein
VEKRRREFVLTTHKKIAECSAKYLKELFRPPLDEHDEKKIIYLKS